jgi:hypothetical protein
MVAQGGRWGWGSGGGSEGAKYKKRRKNQKKKKKKKKMKNEKIAGTRGFESGGDFDGPPYTRKNESIWQITVWRKILVQKKFKKS